jgi:hypothetical protein
MLVFRWTDATRTMIACGNGWFVPRAEGNRHFEELKPWLHLVLDHDAPEGTDVDIEALMRGETPTRAEPEAAPDTQADEVKPAEETSAPSEASGPGIMLDTRAGIMAPDRTEELRARRLGEVVLAYTARVDARFPIEQAVALNDLRRRSNAAGDGTGEPLTAEDQEVLEALALNEIWASRMAAEQRARLTMLASAEAETLATFNAREGWPP